jgi:hypothetical protein
MKEQRFEKVVETGSLDIGWFGGYFILSFFCVLSIFYSFYDGSLFTIRLTLICAMLGSISAMIVDYYTARTVYWRRIK